MELEPLKEEPSQLGPSSAAGHPLKELLLGHWDFLPLPVKGLPSLGHQQKGK